MTALLVHLSDIHFSADDSGLAERNRAVRVELVRDLERMQAELGDATAVVVTGDIAFSAEAAQYVVARDWLEEVSALVGAEDPLVLTVPGNHDVHWPDITASAREARESLRNCGLEDLTPRLDRFLDDPTRPLVAALANYNEFALGYRCEVNPNGRPWKASVPLLAGYHLELCGVTTVFNSDRSDTQGSLVVGRTQTSLPRDTPGRSSWSWPIMARRTAATPSRSAIDCVTRQARFCAVISTTSASSASTTASRSSPVRCTPRRRPVGIRPTTGSVSTSSLTPTATTR
jgi:hypothetical protein